MTSTSSSTKIPLTFDLRLGVLPENAKTATSRKPHWTNDRRVGETALKVSSKDEFIVNLQTDFGISHSLLVALDIQIPSLPPNNKDKVSTNKALKLVPGLLEILSDGTVDCPSFVASPTSSFKNVHHDNKIKPMQWHRLILLVDFKENGDEKDNTDTPTSDDSDSNTSNGGSVAAIWLDDEPLSLFEGIQQNKEAESAKDIFCKDSFQIGDAGSNDLDFILRFIEIQHHPKKKLNILDWIQRPLNIPGGKVFNNQKAIQKLKLLNSKQSSRLSLRNVFQTKTMPIWKSSVWAAKFFDPFMEGSGTMDFDLQCDKSFSVFINVLCKIQGIAPKNEKKHDDHEDFPFFSEDENGNDDEGGEDSTLEYALSLDHQNDADFPPGMEVDEKVKDAAKLICDMFIESKGIWKSYASFVETSLASNYSSDGEDEQAGMVVKKLMTLFEQTVNLGKPCIIPAGWKTENSKSWYFLTILVIPDNRQEVGLGDEKRTFSVWICNPGSEGMEWHPSKIAYPHKNKFRKSIALPCVRYERLVDEGFWTMFYAMSRYVHDNRSNRSFLLYDTLLPWLCEQPLESAIIEGFENGLECSWSSPQYSESSHFRSILEGTKCSLAFVGNLKAKDEVKLFSYQIRLSMIEMAMKDLQLMAVISDEDILLIKMATEQLSLAAVKEYDRNKLSRKGLLRSTRNIVETMKKLLKNKAKFCVGKTTRNIISLNKNRSSKIVKSDGALHPFFERIAFQNVQGKEGSKIPLPKQLPVNFLAIKQRLVNPYEIFDTLRQVEVLCLELSGLEAQGSLKRSSFVKTSLLTSVFTSIVPVPPPPHSNKHHAWEFTSEAPLSRGQQEEIVQLLGRLCNHFMAACFSTTLTKYFDGTRLVVLGVITTICDYLVRQKPVDNVSPLSLVLRGENIVRDDASHKKMGEKKSTKCSPEYQEKQFRSPSFGVRARYFMQQTDNAKIASPEVNIARSCVNQYFEMQNIPESNFIFEWEAGNWSMKLNDADANFCKIIANAFYKKVDGGEISGGFICNNIVLFRPWRDICFWFKYVQCTDDRIFPSVKNYTPEAFQLQWKWDGQNFEVQIPGKNLIDESVLPRPSHLRWDSDSSITSLDINANSEDDLLHIKELPNFDNVIGQADAELLLSYLSVPYMRIPCLLEFFSSESRIHALGCKDIRRLLEGSMLEPWRTLPISSQNIAPRHVPCTNDDEAKMMGSTYGLLLNECAKAPQLAPMSLLKLLEQAIELGSGGKQSFHSNTTTIITFLLRMASYMETTLAFLLQLATNTHPSLHSNDLTGIKLTEQSRCDVEKAFEKFQLIIRVNIRETLQRWKEQLEKELKDAINDQRTGDNDTITNHLCDVHAHLLLTVRNVPLRQYSNDRGSSQIGAEDMRILITSSQFLMQRHTFHQNSLSVPEHEIYDILDHRRTDIIDYVRSLHEENPRYVHKLLQEMFQVGTGVKDRMTAWASYSGSSNIGRYATMHFEKRGKEQERIDFENSYWNKMSFIASSQPDVEINLQLLQVTTYGGAFLQALDEDIASNKDMKELFGNDLSKLQVFNTGSYENMKERKLESWDYIIRQWTADSNLPENINIGDEYDPMDLDRHLTWIKDTFEPCRQTHFVDPELKWHFASDDDVSACTEVVILVGKNKEKNHKPWLEAAIHKTSQMVQIFMIRSYGRRFYRTLEYSTNSLYTYRDLQPSPKNRDTEWPVWARYEAFQNEEQFKEDIEYWTPPDHPKSVVILRHHEIPKQPEEQQNSSTHEDKRRQEEKCAKIQNKESFSYSSCDIDGPIWSYSQECSRNDAFQQLKKILANEAGFENIDYDPSTEEIHAKYKCTYTGIYSTWAEFNFTHLSGTSRSIQVSVGNVLDAELTIILFETLSRRLVAIGWDAPEISLGDESWIPLKKMLPSRTICTSRLEVTTDDHDELSKEDDKPEQTETKDYYFDVERGMQLEQYLPSHLFAGLLPEALLEKYDIYQECKEDSKVLHGYPKGSANVHNSGMDSKRNIRLSKCEEYENWLDIELVEKDITDRVSQQFMTTVHTTSEKRLFAKVKRHSMKGERQHVLLPSLYSEPGSQPNEIASVLSRVEPLSQILIWAKENPEESTYLVDYIELVRLKLRFKMKEVNGRYRLYSEEHPGLFLPDFHSQSGEIPAQSFSSAIPHSLLLCSELGEYSFLVPNVRAVRPLVKDRPFNCGVVLKRGRHDRIWSLHMSVQFFKYNVHTSGAFLECETLASALYLITMYTMSRDYVKAFMLVQSVTSDVLLSSEEAQILRVFSGIESGNPNFHALRVALMLALGDSSAVLEWDLREEFALYLRKQSHIHVRCRLTQQEEYLAIKLCEKENERLEVIKSEIEGLPEEERVEFYYTIIAENIDDVDSTLVEAGYKVDKFAIACCNKCERKGILTNVDEVKHRFSFLMERKLRTEMSQNNEFILQTYSDAADKIKGIKVEEGKKSITIKSRVSKTNQTTGEWLSRNHYQLPTSPEALGSGSQILSPFNSNESPSKLLEIVRDTIEKKYNVEGQTKNNDETEDIFSIFYLPPCFLLIYQLLTGQICIGFRSKNPVNTHTFASLMTLFIHQGDDSADEKLQLAILYTLIRNPWICEAHIMPKCKSSLAMRSSSSFPSEIDYSGESKEDLFSKLICDATATLADIKKNGWESEEGKKFYLEGGFQDKVPVSIPNISDKYELELAYFTEPSGKKTVAWKSPLKGLIERTNEGIKVSNYQRKELALKELKNEVDFQLLDNLLNHIFCEVTTNEVCSSNEAGFIDINQENKMDDRSIPKILQKHPNADSRLAQEMLDRLDLDVAAFMDQKHKELTEKPMLAKLIDVYKFLYNNDTIGILKNDDIIEDAKVILEQIRQSLRSLKEKDTYFVKQSLKKINERNSIIEDNEEEEESKDRFLLLCHSGQETNVWFELIVSALMSNVGNKDLHKLDPFVTKEKWDKYLNIAAITLLRTNRINVTNSTIKDTDEVIRVLLQIRQKKDKGTSLKDEMLDLKLKLDALCTKLMIRRVYSDKVKVDPRFLVFEFLSGIVLRQRQVELVRECVQKAQTNQSVVKQMIMGAGKTAVVSPLICLLLAHGDYIITQCVPTELLASSTSLMRKLFSRIISKRVYSFSCDRSTIPNASMQAKLTNAKETGGIVMTTPGSIKSLILNFVEGLSSKMDSSSKLFQSKDLTHQLNKWSEIVNIFSEGVCIMDEVDMVLHPLKSELNFPIGEKISLDFSDDGQRWQLPMAVLDVILFAGEYASSRKTSVSESEVPSRLKIGNSEKTQEFLDLLIAIIIHGLGNNKLQMNKDRIGFILLQEGFYSEHLERETLQSVAENLQIGKGDKQPVSFLSLMVKFYTYYLERIQIPMNLEDIEEYLSHCNTCKEKAEIFKKKTIECSKDQMKYLNLAHDWIHVYIPHVFRKIDRVTFGLLSETDLQACFNEGKFVSPSRQKLAIPFISKDVPAPTSEFAQPDVVIGLTYLGYRYEGMRFNDFKEMVSRLQSDFLQEMGPFDRRPTNEMWVEWINSAPKRLKLDNNDPILKISLKTLDRSDNSHMKPLFDLLQFSAEATDWFLNDLTFPNLMKFQEKKLSASGQDMGGAILFKRSVGFSGTASELLPQELVPKEGDHLFERCSEGRILDSLTSRDIVTCRKLSDDWSPKVILDMIAKDTSREYHALIDTGALITGYSNVGVAEYLLQSDDHLKGFDGVVYIDENDQKMIRTRDNYSMQIEDCNIGKDKYFVFYDQMHTTGMDIQHRLRACAALTLGKDMTWRDYQQGAYRMRGIGKGQTIELLVSPQVHRLINDDFACFPPGSFTAKEENSIKGVDDSAISSKMVAVWQILQQLRSERLQYTMLQQQNLANLWRKPAFVELRKNYVVALRRSTISEECYIQQLKDDPRMQKELKLIDEALLAFLENVSMPVHNEVPPALSNEEIFEKMKQNKEHWLETRSAKDAIQKIMENVKGSKVCHERNCAMEREMQKEEEQERELEQETELERFVDLQYKTDKLDPTPWKFEDIRLTDSFDDFYPASEFKIHGTNLKMPIYKNGVPEDLQFSRNYFNPKWSGLRRLRNICILLEYVPNQEQLEVNGNSDIDFLAKRDVEDSLQRTLERIGTSLSENESCTTINRDALQMILEEYLGLELDSTVIDKNIATLHTSTQQLNDKSSFTMDEVKQILLRNVYQKQDNRRFTVISLAEAETIRRIIHVRTEEDKDIIDGWGTTIALHSIPHGGKLMDVSRGYQPGSSQQKSHVIQLARFFDGKMKYDRTDLIPLLHMLQLNNLDARKDFFVRMTACRRRFNGKWQGRPVAAVLNDFNDEFMMLRKNIMGRLLKFAIQSHDEYGQKNLEKVFYAFDTLGDKVLHVSETVNALRAVGMSFKNEDIAELIFFADKNQDGVISKREFMHFLSGNYHDMKEEHLKPRYFDQQYQKDNQKLTNDCKEEDEIRLVEQKVEKMKEEFAEARKENYCAYNKTIKQMRDSVKGYDDGCVSNPIWDENNGKGHGEWDFNTLPTFVEVQPYNDACVPCQETDEESYKDRYYQEVNRGGSIHVKVANVLKDHVSLCSWSLTLFTRLDSLPHDAEDCSLFTLERGDNGPGVSLCIDCSGDFFLLVDGKKLNPTRCYFNNDVSFKDDMWNIVTMVVEQPKMMGIDEYLVNIYLNCEPIIEFKVPLDTADQHARSQFLLDVAEGGVQLFGNSSNCKHGIRKMWISPFAMEELDVFSHHVALGCWRCQNTECPKDVSNTLPKDCTFNMKGMRNAPDAATCCLCNKTRPRSQDPPTANPHPDHPGLFIVTRTTFEETVLNCPFDVFLMNSADWCPASKNVKPVWYELAKLLCHSKDIRIAYMDADKNQPDRKYIWENSIPNLKFFARKRDSEGNIENTLNNKERPIRFKEQSTLRSLLTFIHDHTKSDGRGESIIDAHYDVYAKEHQLPQAFHKMFEYFELAVSQCKEKDERGDMLLNPERWFALYFDDPLTMVKDIVTTTSTTHQVEVGDERCVFTVVTSTAQQVEVGDTGAVTSMKELGNLWRSEEYKKNRSTHHLVDQLLEKINNRLKIELPSQPFSFLSRYLEDVHKVSAHTKLSNAPDMLLKDFYKKCKQAVQWDIYDGSENMDERGVQMVWSDVIDKMQSVCSATPGALHEQAMKKMSNLIRQVAGEGYSLDSSPFGPSLAWVSAGMGVHSELLNTLWWSGANVQRRSFSDQTLPIEVAAAMGHTQTVHQLYRMGCCIGRAAHFAATESQLEVLELLFAPKDQKVGSRKYFGFGLSPNHRIAGITLLEGAVIASNTPVVCFLLDQKGLDLRRVISSEVREVYKLNEESTILHLCAQLGGSRGKILRCIVEKDNDIIALKDQCGRRARDLCDDANILAAISENSTGKSCWDIIYDFIDSDWNEEKQRRMILELKERIENGADQSARNGVGWTPLMILCLICNYEAIKVILDCHNLVNDNDDDRNPHLGSSEPNESDVASRNRQAQAEQILYMTSSSGLTALMWAEWMVWVMKRLGMYGKKGDGEIQNRQLLTEKIPFVDVYALNNEFSTAAQKIMTEFIKHGATLRRKDEQGLELLKDKFTTALQNEDMVTISLLLFNPKDLKLCREKFDSTSDLESQDTVALSDAFEERIKDLGTLNGSQVIDFVPHSYKPKHSLEEFLSRLDQSKLKNGAFWAPAFQNSIKSLIVSSKLFVQDCIASGKSSLPAEDIFALHIYTLQSSIYSEVNAAMRDVDKVQIIFWRPYIFFLSRALGRLNVEGAVVLRGIKLDYDNSNDGTVKKFLNGRYCTKDEQDTNAMYHPGKKVLWPAFSSTSLSRHIALGYSTMNLTEKDAAVICKIYCRSGRSISKYSFYPFEEELLFSPNTRFRVVGFSEPTLSTLQQHGAISSHSNSPYIASFRTDNRFLQVMPKLTLEEAQNKKVVVISMEELPESVEKIDLEDFHATPVNQNLVNKQDRKEELKAEISKVQSELEQLKKELLVEQLRNNTGGTFFLIQTHPPSKI